MISAPFSDSFERADLGAAWTSTGTPHQARGLKHRPDGAIRVIPLPAALTSMLRWHLAEFGTAPDGRLFPRRPWRHPQRKQLRKDLARRPPRSARPRTSRHRAGPGGPRLACAPGFV